MPEARQDRSAAGDRQKRRERRPHAAGPLLETAEVRRRVRRTIEQARHDAAERRARAAVAEEQGLRFLEDIATPVARQLVSVLRAEGFVFRLSTPAGAVRLVSDRRREDFIDIAVDATDDAVTILTTVSHVRGGRVLTTERPLAADVGIDALTEQHVLDFFLDAIRVFVER